MKKEIYITISGKPGSGKSRITFLLKKFLYENGFEIDFDGNMDFPSEGEFDEHMDKNIETFINAFKTTRKIKMKEINIYRHTNSKV